MLSKNDLQDLKKAVWTVEKKGSPYALMQDLDNKAKLEFNSESAKSLVKHAAVFTGALITATATMIALKENPEIAQTVSAFLTSAFETAQANMQSGLSTDHIASVERNIAATTEILANPGNAYFGVVGVATLGTAASALKNRFSIFMDKAKESMDRAVELVSANIESYAVQNSLRLDRMDVSHLSAEAQVVHAKLNTNFVAQKVNANQEKVQTREACFDTNAMAPQ